MAKKKSFDQELRDAAKKPANTNYKRKGRQAYFGRTRGLALVEYLNQIFKYNSNALKAQKLTDNQIADKVRDEYKNYKDLMLSWKAVNGISKVVYFRNLYNRGKLKTDSDYPTLLSYRYDQNGDIITSNRVDTKTTDLDEWVAKYEATYSADLIVHFEGNVPRAYLDRCKWINKNTNSEIMKTALRKRETRVQTMKKRAKKNK